MSFWSNWFQTSLICISFCLWYIYIYTTISNCSSLKSFLLKTHLFYFILFSISWIPSVMNHEAGLSKVSGYWWKSISTPWSWFGTLLGYSFESLKKKIENQPHTPIVRPPTTELCDNPASSHSSLDLGFVNRRWAYLWLMACRLWPSS